MWSVPHRLDLVGLFLGDADRVFRVGSRYVVPVADLKAVLGLA